ncbi:TIM-barrel domain-containing protein [Bacteroides sp. 51]|uniref:glycoside hydrolase family 31 protein n=1 Tax=Bacteroides sp. 51 TaxID=2302938 RepID=UPI0013D618C8|nr:TIM-barrel domain-containing protein [Bacteroides sp. 51]NDV82867.1 glycoside hydrolase family 31 protein [Bacteroides sp. 51]
MKNILIVILSLLLALRLQAQSSGESYFCSSWRGDTTTVKRLQPGLDVSGITVDKYRMQFDVHEKDISLNREVCPSLKAAETLWISFLIHKKEGDSRFGLSLNESRKEKLYIGINDSRKIVFGDKVLNPVLERPSLVLIRIDYSKEGDKAYAFINPSVASVPDIEGAEWVLTGNFKFDQLHLLAGKGTSGDMSNIKLGTEFQQVVDLRKVVQTVNEGQQQTVKSWKKENETLQIETTGGTLYMQPFVSGSLHIQYGDLGMIRQTSSYAVTDKPQTSDFTVTEDSRSIILQAPNMKVLTNKQSGHISLYNASGKLLVEELPGGARYNMTGDSVNPFCKFKLNTDDALYGLGQFRDKKMNLRNSQRELIQFNTQAAVPVLYSTGGWGIFWDNPSRTLFKDDRSGMSFVSDYGNIVDYYLFVGNRLDELIAAYRSLTGQSPMIADWTLGFHQSRNKYTTQKEVLDISRRMKEEGIPSSSIFIDYYYWEKYGTGSHRFDETLFPDIPQMLDSLHNVYGVKVVLTVWPTFKPSIPNYSKLAQHGYLLYGAKALDGFIYDAFNPAAGKMYWEMVAPLAGQNIDGWFLDGPEPDHPASFLPSTTYAGPAAKVRNLYPLVHSSNFYNGLSACRPNVRPYFLTRCAWASQQKYGTAVWSGDIPATFDELETQVTAGLNFTATGIPYWTTDIGGYSGGDPADENYRELFTRWFQYGTFCPVFRSHGRRYPGDRKTSNELWAYGPEVQRICTDYIKLRYRLLPYIYTLTGNVTHHSYTPMRLLAFDFPNDKKVFDCKDQFMYGPAFLICPVVKPGATSRSVYLPAGHTWTDFRTGNVYSGGTEIKAEAPLDYMPLYVKSGSVIPYYTSLEKYVNTRTPMEIQIFGGEDGSFDLYEDDGSSMEYMAGNYSVIPLKWDNAKRTFTVGARAGNYGEKTRTFIIRLKGVDGKQDITRKIKYNGKEQRIKL